MPRNEETNMPPNQKEAGVSQGQMHKAEASLWQRAIQWVLPPVVGGTSALAPIDFKPPAVTQEAKGSNPANGLDDKLAEIGVGMRKTSAAPLESGAPVLGGWFFNETNGGAPSEKGYRVTGPMYEAFQKIGGIAVLGYPVSQVFVDEAGRVTQAFQKGIPQLRVGPNGEIQSIEFANVYDELSRAGKDEWLRNARQTPKAFDWSSDRGKSWDQVVASHLAMLDPYSELKAAYLSNPKWLEMYGLPMGVEIKDGAINVRGQRATLHQWQKDVPWAKAGEVTVANGGDVAKEAGVLPPSALLLEDQNFASTNPSPEAPKANLKGLPPGGISTPELRDIVLRGITWEFREGIDATRHHVTARGKLVSARLDGDRIVVSVITDKSSDSAREMVLEPREGEPLSFWFNRNGYIKLGETTNPQIGLEALETYVKNGDPIEIGRRIRGGDTGQGYIQRFVTWR